MVYIHGVYFSTSVLDIYHRVTIKDWFQTMKILLYTFVDWRICTVHICVCVITCLIDDAWLVVKLILYISLPGWLGLIILQVIPVLSGNSYGQFLLIAKMNMKRHVLAETRKRRFWLCVAKGSCCLVHWSAGGVSWLRLIVVDLSRSVQM